MKKNLFLVLLFVVQYSFAQIVSYDNSFASSGIHSIASNISINDWSRMVQNSDGSIYFTYSKNNNNTGLPESFLSKLTANGIIDTSFGTNGEIQLPYYNNDNQLKKQTDGKLIVLGFDSGATITRILSNGQIDTTFGISGTTTIPNLSSDSNDRSCGLTLQNDKILVYGIDFPDGSSQQIHPQRIYRLNATGSIDSAFGNNGSLFSQGNWGNGSFVLTDNQSNIITVTNSGIMEKFNSNGQPLTNFGNNGILQMSFSLNFAGDVFMDSNNNIVYSTLNDEVFRINPDGTLDSRFNYNLYAHSGINGGAWILKIIEKNGYYYVGGYGEVDFANTYFISKLDQNGTVNSNFNYFSESNPNLIGIGDMIVNDNNIIANGSGYIVKYLLNNVTLSATETGKNNQEIFFENPVRQNLVFSTKEKVSKIEIYSLDGKLVKTIRENHTNVSELSKGTYIAKTILENGKTILKKLLKN